MPKITVLIDDDADDIQFLQEALQELDSTMVCYKFDSPVDAVASLSKLGSVVPDYVFIDFNMPNMNGFECLLELKALPKLATTKFIINSTFIDETMTKTFLSNGAFHVFRKPYKVQSYLKILNQVFKRD